MSLFCLKSQISKKYQILVVFLCLFTGYSGFAQNHAYVNSKGQKMESLKGNFTSFSSSKSTTYVEQWKIQNKANYYNHPEFGTMAFNAPSQDFVELLDKRQIDYRYFINPINPSEFFIQQALGDLHFEKNGYLVTIDHHLLEKGNGIFEAERQPEPVGFDIKDKISFINTPNGKVNFNQWKLYGIDHNNNEILIASPDWSNYTAGDDGLYITDIFPGIDASMIVMKGAVKTNLIVKSFQNENYKSIIFRDEFALKDVSSSLQFMNNKNETKAVDRVHLFAGNQSFVEIGEAVAYLENGKKEDKYFPVYDIEKNHLGIVIPTSWLTQNLLLGNVIIDPLVTSTNTLAQAAITGSRYNASCDIYAAGALSCDYNLVVNTPPAAVFTDIQFSFSYIAQGICFQEDGGMRFTLNSCISPNAAGFIWTCQVPAAATCPGNNISILSDLTSCIPAPSCVAQPLNFGMKFYRSCFGTTGAACSGTCIGAAAPWIISISGKTLEFTNANPNQFSISTNSVCEGQNITANMLGAQFGIGPYTTNWSLSPTGLPSLGTGSPLSINFPTAGAYTLYCIVTDACGSTSSASKAITITPPPSAPVVTSPVTYCQNASASILTATGASLEWFTVPVGGSPTGAPTPATGVPGTTSYYVQQTVGGCVSPRAQIDVVVNPFPTFGGGASATPASCGASDGAITGLTASGTGTITYVWSNTVPVVVSTTTTNANLSNQPAGNYNLTVTDANGCSNTYGPVVITSAAPPSGPTVTTPISYCLGATALALTATGSNLLWYTVPVGGVGSAVAPTPSTAIVGSTMYYVSQTISGCESARIQIEVIINNAPAAPTVTSPVNLCQSAVASALTATGVSLLWYTVPVGGVGSATAPTPSTAATGSVIYYVSQTSGGCESPRAQITVQVNAPPVINGTASVTPSSCGLSDGAITGLSATGVVTLTYTWTNAVAAVVSTSTTNATLSNQPAGTYTLTVTDAVGCSTVGTPVQITNNAAPAAPVATSPINYCQGAVASQLSATGTSLLWYTVAVGGTGSAIAPTPSTAAAGTVSYYVSQTVAGCESPYTQIDIIVNPTPVAPTVTSPVSYCSGATPTALTATGSGLLWYTVAVGGTGSATAPTPSTLTAGSTSYYVTQTVSGCESPNAQIVVQVNAAPVINGVAVVTPSNCGASDGAITGLSATGVVTLTYTWTNAVAAVVSSSTTNATLSNQPAGTYTLTVTDAVGCSTVGTPVQITNNAAPAAPVATTPINYCQGAVASQLSATGTSLLWYTIAVGGTGSATAPTPSTAAAGTVSYYVSQTVAGCESPYTQIDIIVNPSPAAPTVTTPVNYCSGATPTALTATGSGLLWYTVAVGGTGSATAPTPSTLTAGSTSYYVTQTVSGCESPNSQIVVQVNAAPVISGVPVVTPSNCGASDGSIIGYTASGTGTLTYTWTDASSSVISTSTTSSDLINQSAGTYTLTVSDAAGCTAVAASQQITNTSAPSCPSSNHTCVLLHWS
jgi:nitrous oxide reductase accessory protein NosL